MKLNLRSQINDDYLSAFKNRETDKKLFLSVIKGEIETEFKRSGKDDDETVINILRKIEKSLKQTNTTESLSELQYLENYLPKLMTKVEIETEIGTLKLEGISDFGMLMKEFNLRFKGKADNNLVSEVIRKSL